MGKKAQIKKMRQQLRAVEVKPLPVMNERANEYSYLTMEQAIEAFPHDNPAKLLAMYKHSKQKGFPGLQVKTKTAVIVRNHDRATKQAFLRSGLDGVLGYYTAVGKKQNEYLEQKKRAAEAAGALDADTKANA